MAFLIWDFVAAVLHFQMSGSASHEDCSHLCHLLVVFLIYCIARCKCKCVDLLYDTKFVALQI